MDQRSRPRENSWMSEWQILKFEADLDIVKVYEYSIPTRLGVCEQREIRATLEILEYDCAYRHLPRKS